MNFDLEPYHAARAMAVLSAIPVFWVFVVQGVTTTTSYDLATGDVSSDSDLGAQIGKTFIFILLTAFFSAAEWYTRKNATPWPTGIRRRLAEFGLFSRDSSGENNPGSRPNDLRQ